MADLTLIVVNYRSAALCRSAVASARAASAEPLEVIVVDNSCDRVEADLLASVGADTLIVAHENLGYARGVNEGMRAASGSKIVVSNPDVVFGARCIDLLVEQLAGRVALTGPRFAWDEAGQWLLPPTDVLTARSRFAAIVAKRSPACAARRSRLRFFERLEFWRSSEPRRAAAVSGAVMAIDRSALERVGGFDGRYRLYYEEIDLMRSLARMRYEILHVPAARCHHMYDQSAVSSPEHHVKFAESESYYMAKWHPGSMPFLALLDSGRHAPEPPSLPMAPGDAIPIPGPSGTRLVEVSPLESFDTAVGHFPNGAEARLPSEIWERFHGPALFVRVVEVSSGREIARGRMSKSK